MRSFLLIAYLTIVTSFESCLESLLSSPSQPCEHFKWDLTGEKPSRQTELTLRFAIRQENVEVLEKLLYAVSMPSSPMYGQHMTAAQVNTLMNNKTAAVRVLKHLMSASIDILHNVELLNDGSFVLAKMSVEQVETMFSTEFFTLQHREVNMTIHRAASYKIPEEIRDSVDFVSGIISFPPEVHYGIRSEQVLVTDDDTTGYVTPGLINSVYDVESNTVINRNASQSVFESFQYFSPDDLTQFCDDFGIPEQVIGTIIGTNKADQCTRDANSCAEADLDVEYILGMAQGSNVTFWSVGLFDTFTDWISDVAALDNPPRVHSISYGSIEEQQPASDMDRFNQEAAKLGLRGVTIVVSSGDDGVANYMARGNPSQCGFHPSWPASSPYVVAVGATMGPENGEQEVACQSNLGGVITTGGGFSTAFDTPLYQQDEVASFLSTCDVPDSMYNGQGRGYPDVSLMGANYIVVIGGVEYLVSGTSASAPTFAGMLTLVNDARLSAGKSTLRAL